MLNIFVISNFYFTFAFYLNVNVKFQKLKSTYGWNNSSNKSEENQPSI